MELKELIEKASGKKGVAHCAKADGEVVKELNDVNRNWKTYDFIKN